MGYDFSLYWKVMGWPSLFVIAQCCLIKLIVLVLISLTSASNFSLCVSHSHYINSSKVTQ